MRWGGRDFGMFDHNRILLTMDNGKTYHVKRGDVTIERIPPYWPHTTEV